MPDAGNTHPPARQNSIPTVILTPDETMSSDIFDSCPGSLDVFSTFPRNSSTFCRLFWLVVPSAGPITVKVTCCLPSREGAYMRLARQFLPVLLLILLHRTAFGEQAINWEGTIEGA